MSSYHAWTHRPKAKGGTDPIPGVQIALPNVARYSMLGKELEWLWESGVHTADDFISQDVATAHSTGIAAAEADAPYGAYIETTSQNDYICIGFPLAPRYSVWTPHFIFSAGPDCGIVDMEWQTRPAVFNTGGGFASEDLDEKGNSPINLTSDTGWYRSGEIERYQVDCYDPSSFVFSDINTHPSMYLVGDDGEMLSANTPSGDIVYTDTERWDAGADGSVWWWVRLKAKTKHASSSGYKMRLHGYAMYRNVGDLVLPG